MQDPQQAPHGGHAHVCKKSVQHDEKTTLLPIFPGPDSPFPSPPILCVSRFYALARGCQPIKLESASSCPAVRPGQMGFVLGEDGLWGLGTA